MLMKSTSVIKELEKQQTKAIVFEEDDKEPLVQLKDVYVDMIRNQKLDFENFQGKQVLEKSIEQKYKSTRKVMEYKTKVWKPNYENTISKNVMANCDFY